uniref:hypothetical protein n=1 Tax=Candidatus Electronema sp. TaxID=2698783 RepID=UPI00405710E0
MHKASGRDWRIDSFIKGAVMFYLGIDVAKAKLDCCLLLDEAGGKRKTKVVPNSKAGIAILLKWTAKQNVLVSQAECSGVRSSYHHGGHLCVS